MGGIIDSIFGTAPKQQGDALTGGEQWWQNQLKPMMEQGVNQGMSGQGLYPTAGLPNTPGAQGYNAQGYDAPQPEWNSPTDFSGGYTDIINRMMEPYGDALGSSMGGFSGAGQNVMGSAMGQIAPQIMNQYTNYRGMYDQMGSQASQFGAGAQNQANQFNAAAQNQMAGMGYGGGLQQMQNQQQAYRDPWTMFTQQYPTTTGSAMIGTQGAMSRFYQGSDSWF